MTTSTSSLATSQPADPMSGARSRPRWVRLAGWQTTGYGYTVGGFLAVALVIAAVVLFLVSRNVTPGMSALQIVNQAVPWFLFGSAIYFVTSWLGPLVSAGMSRRSFVRGSVAAAFVVAAGTALVVLALAWAEQRIYGGLGWSAAYDVGPVPTVDAPLVPYLWGLFLLFSVATVTGLIVGLSYTRLGAWATLLLPVTLLPVIVVPAAALDPETMFISGVFSIGTAVEVHTVALIDIGSGVTRFLIGLATLGVSVLVVHLLARRIPINGPRA